MDLPNYSPRSSDDEKTFGRQGSGGGSTIASMRFCKGCGKELEVLLFGDTGDKLYKTCVLCRMKSNSYNIRHKEQLKSKRQEYRKRNREKISKQEKAYKDKAKTICVPGKRRCKKCGRQIDIECFGDTSDKKYSNCIECRMRRNAIYEANRTKELKRDKEYRSTENGKQNRTKWCDANRAKMRLCRKRNHQKNKVDPKYVVIRRLRSRLKNAFKVLSLGGKLQDSNKYGIDYEAIFQYIGPCPGNRKEWHIDHIIPLSSFDFDDPEQVKEAFAPENHQWLPKIDNLRKGSNGNMQQGSGELQ